MNLGLVLMCKDEASVIDACLASVRPHIALWTVVDTGSTDDTPERVLAALEGIPGRLLRMPFVNFGHSRSELLVAARGTADWLLASDADMTWEIDPDFEPDPAVDCYMVEMGSDGFSYRLPLVLRGDLPWKSVGAVHEYTALPNRPYRGVPTDKVRVTHHGEGRTSPEKTRWQADLLEAADPSDPRTVFYLAQSYRELGDPRAIELYERRASMGGYEEERWYAQYRAALLEPDWRIRHAKLLAAWNARPTRLEPLHALVSELNYNDQHHAAYALTHSYALVPPGDLLFVHRDVWDYGMDLQRSIAAWYVGERAESAVLSRTLLQNPRLPVSVREAVIRNLALTPAEEAA